MARAETCQCHKLSRDVACRVSTVSAPFRVATVTTTTGGAVPRTIRATPGTGT